MPIVRYNGNSEAFAPADVSGSVPEGWQVESARPLRRKRISLVTSVPAGTKINTADPQTVRTGIVPIKRRRYIFRETTEQSWVVEAPAVVQPTLVADDVIRIKRKPQVPRDTDELSWVIAQAVAATVFLQDDGIRVRPRKSVVRDDGYLIPRIAFPDIVFSDDLVRFKPRSRQRFADEFPFFTPAQVVAPTVVFDDPIRIKRRPPVIRYQDELVARIVQVAVTPTLIPDEGVRVKRRKPTVRDDEYLLPKMAAVVAPTVVFDDAIRIRRGRFAFRDVEYLLPRIVAPTVTPTLVPDEGIRIRRRRYTLDTLVNQDVTLTVGGAPVPGQVEIMELFATTPTEPVSLTSGAPADLELTAMVPDDLIFTV